jgi:hypothetical protein
VKDAEEVAGLCLFLMFTSPDLDRSDSSNRLGAVYPILFFNAKIRVVRLRADPGGSPASRDMLFERTDSIVYQVLRYSG